MDSNVVMAFLKKAKWTEWGGGNAAIVWWHQHEPVPARQPYDLGVTTHWAGLHCVVSRMGTGRARLQCKDTVICGALYGSSCRLEWLCGSLISIRRGRWHVYTGHARSSLHMMHHVEQHRASEEQDSLNLGFWQTTLNSLVVSLW